MIPESHGGPRGIGHGGYVVGLLAAHVDGTTQVTLRKPAPLDVDLDLVRTDEGRIELRHGEEVIADAIAATLDLEVPTPPSLDEARAAEPGSPSRYGDKGVHPTCFGCAQFRDDDLGLGIGVGPIPGASTPGLVASTWRPRAEHATADGNVDPLYVTAAIDCPGAFAFIAHEQRAGLLGRMVVAQYAPVPSGEDLVVFAWQMGGDGRKLFAGSALATASGDVLAASAQTWFDFRR